MVKAHRGNTVSKGNGYQAVIEVPSWEELSREAVKDTDAEPEEALRSAGFLTRGGWADAWGVPNTTTIHRLNYLVKTGVMERKVGLSGTRLVSFWRKKP
jgi:hypothetical protein